uniref:SH3 domain and tetratricopeptide repeats 1 n=1 Tax=Labrus bergylta TaxID=56723 RepID=A0A3Q3G3L1_9LABR
MECVRGSERLPADDCFQEELRGKLRILQTDSSEVTALFMELSAHLIAIDSEESIFLLTFKTFEEIWKFTTYYTIGFLGLCLENLLLEQKFWLRSLEDDVSVEVSVEEETLNLMYRGILMQEGTPPSGSAESLHLKLKLHGAEAGQGLRLLTNTQHTHLSVRETTPLINQISFLCSAGGTCEATEEYDAEGPDELSLAPGDRIIIVGLLVSCFDWFTGRKEVTGEVGLVKTSCFCSRSIDILLTGEDRPFFSLSEDRVIEETSTFLKKRSHHDTGLNYKLGETESVLLQLSPVSLLPGGRREQQHGELRSLFSCLESQDYRAEFGVLYGLSSEAIVSSAFSGHSGEAELMAFLGAARETARKKRLFWSQTRLCFLLGKLCAGRSKFSQARVYFEEALGVPREGFTDLRLLASIYSNLAAIYLLQNNSQSFFAVTERLVALLLGVSDCLESLEDDSALKYMLKKAVLSHNTKAEARACHLLARHHWTQSEEFRWFLTWRDFYHSYLTLGRLYSQLRLPHLSISSARITSVQPSATLTDCLSSMLLALDNINRLCNSTEQETSIPTQVAPYLHQALTSTRVLQPGSEQHYVLIHQLTVCLCQLFCKHRMVGHAIHHMHTLINNRQLLSSAPERNITLIRLAWLHINNNQPQVALEILDLLLDSMPEHCTTPQEGVVLNLRGVALRCMGDLRRAAESYEAAVDICQEYEDMANWAVAQANLGLLSLRGGAKRLAQSHLVEAVQLFSELDDEGHEENFISVLLELGQLYVRQQQMDYGKGCYEWALLLAIKANLLACQLTATTHLIRLYCSESQDQVQCLIYSQHQVHLLRRSGDRGEEGGALVAVSRLYLSLGTDRAYRAALDHTKTSLGIFIDLGCREKEALGWLQAGNIYHLLEQTELVEVYVQVAQDVALSSGDTGFILKLLEAAGDIFFNSSRDRDKAIPFYRDRALPIAVRSSSVSCRLRLCNKLSELMLSLQMFEEGVEFAQTALDISITLGDCLNQRVAYYRLASLYHRLDQYELAEHHYLKTLTLCPTPLLFDEETLYYVRVYQTLGDIIFYDLKVREIIPTRMWSSYLLRKEYLNDDNPCVSHYDLKSFFMWSLQDPFDAAGYYHLALAAAMDLGNKRAQLQLCTRLATIYHNFLIDRELSLFFYQKARAFAAELNVRRVNISPDQQQCSSSAAQ